MVNIMRFSPVCATRYWTPAILEAVMLAGHIESVAKEERHSLEVLLAAEMGMSPRRSRELGSCALLGPLDHYLGDRDRFRILPFGDGMSHVGISTCRCVWAERLHLADCLRTLSPSSSSDLPNLPKMRPGGL